jgi:hypothetical protein
MVQAEWEKLIIEVKLNDMMEAVGTGVAHSKYYFINFGKKEKLNHWPIDQFTGGLSRSSKADSLLCAYQQKFHKNMSDILLTLHTVERFAEVAPMAKEVCISSDSKPEKDSVTSGPFEECFIDFHLGVTSLLFQLFGGSGKALKQHLNAF